MNLTGQLFLRFARGIAGAQRSEWIDAMEAEASTLGRDSTPWAIGCFWAAVNDRALREWRFLAAILLLPICVVVLQMILFHPIVAIGRLAGLPDETFIVVFLLLPLPFAFILGRLRPGLPAYFALPVTFVICQMTPLVIFWLKFGKSPFSWFGKDAHWYNMTPTAGLTCAFLVWIVGAWLGSRRSKAT